MTDYVFGYGSLVAATATVTATATTGDSASAYPAVLLGWSRGWTVAMDNTATIAGYKYYLSIQGDRPEVCVAFLDAQPRPGAEINGVCRAVDAETLARLDRRERNYLRTNITGLLDRAEGRTWIYQGVPSACGRAARARAEGKLVAARAYRDGVRAAFALLGSEQLAMLDRTTEPPDAAMADLVRVDVPEDQAPV